MFCQIIKVKLRENTNFDAVSRYSMNTQEVFAFPTQEYVERYEHTTFFRTPSANRSKEQNHMGATHPIYYRVQMLEKEVHYAFLVSAVFTGVYMYVLVITFNENRYLWPKANFTKNRRCNPDCNFSTRY